MAGLGLVEADLVKPNISDPIREGTIAVMDEIESFPKSERDSLRRKILDLAKRNPAVADFLLVAIPIAVGSSAFAFRELFRKAPSSFNVLVRQILGVSGVTLIAVGGFYLLRTLFRDVSDKENKRFIEEVLDDANRRKDNNSHDEKYADPRNVTARSPS